MLSLAVGTMRTVRGKVLYTACHFIDDEWKLHKVIMDAYPDLHFYDLRAGLLGVDYVCLSPHFIRSAIGKVVDDILYNRDLDNVFMMVWEIEGSHDIDRKLEKYQFIATNHTSTTYMDNVIHSIARLLTLHRDFTGEMYSDLLDLDLTRQDRHRFFSQLGLDYHHLWTYNEDWYSQYCSLEILRNKGYGYTDTLFTELLCMLWGAIYRSIQRISAPNCPTSSNLCLLQLFNLREVFRHQLAKASGEDAFAYNDSNGFHALEDGKDVADILREAMVALDKALQDFYLIWSIPLILDPRYKLVFTKSIFETAYGSQAAEYISKVQQNISELYSAYVEDQTELVCYLEDERVLDLAEGFDILSWWKVHGSVRYPTVARMARDALAMPTSSTLSSEQISHVMSIIRGYSMKGWFS
uniref:HAT C-terminal dimerisation domain-containing protein n=2 Tax=Oryza brachyantha TaxID=4533 RepID=J3NC59_ORYBR